MEEPARAKSTDYDDGGWHGWERVRWDYPWQRQRTLQYVWSWWLPFINHAFGWRLSARSTYAICPLLRRYLSITRLRFQPPARQSYSKWICFIHTVQFYENIDQAHVCLIQKANQNLPDWQASQAHEGRCWDPAFDCVLFSLPQHPDLYDWL